MQTRWCNKIQLKLKIRHKKGRGKVFLRLSDFQVGPRQRVRHVGVDGVTETTAEVRWSDDSPCTQNFRVKTKWGTLTVGADHRTHRLAGLAPASLHQVEVAPCLGGVCGSYRNVSFTTFPDLDMLGLQAWNDRHLRAVVIQLAGLKRLLQDKASWYQVALVTSDKNLTLREGRDMRTLRDTLSLDYTQVACQISTVLQLSVQQFHSVQVYKFPLSADSLGTLSGFSRQCNLSDPINHTSGGSSHFSGNTSPHVTSLGTILTATFVCILVLAAAVGFVLMCLKKKPRVVPAMTQQISTISGGYREFGLTPISTPATPQRKFLQET